MSGRIFPIKQDEDMDAVLNLLSRVELEEVHEQPDDLHSRSYKHAITVRHEGCDVTYYFSWDYDEMWIKTTHTNHEYSPLYRVSNPEVLLDARLPYTLSAYADEGALLSDLTPNFHFSENHTIQAELDGTAIYEGRYFALITVFHDTASQYLVEYHAEAPDKYVLMASSSGWSSSIIGLMPSYAQFGDITVAWSEIFDTRCATTADEQTLLDASVPMDYTHVRFYWPNGTMEESEVRQDRSKNCLFFHVLSTDGLPEYAVPVYKDVEIPAAASFTESPYGSSQFYPTNYYNNALETYYPRFE